MTCAIQCLVVVVAVWSSTASQGEVCQDFDESSLLQVRVAPPDGAQQDVASHAFNSFAFKREHAVAAWWSWPASCKTPIQQVDEDVVLKYMFGKISAAVNAHKCSKVCGNITEQRIDGVEIVRESHFVMVFASYNSPKDASQFEACMRKARFKAMRCQQPLVSLQVEQALNFASAQYANPVVVSGLEMCSFLALGSTGDATRVRVSTSGADINGKAWLTNACGGGDIFERDGAYKKGHFPLASPCESVETAWLWAPARADPTKKNYCWVTGGTCPAATTSAPSMVEQQEALRSHAEEHEAMWAAMVPSSGQGQVAPAAKEAPGGPQPAPADTAQAAFERFEFTKMHAAAVWAVLPLVQRACEKTARDWIVAKINEQPGCSYDLFDFDDVKVFWKQGIVMVFASFAEKAPSDTFATCASASCLNAMQCDALHLTSSYTVSSGPYWQTLPPVFSAQTACAIASEGITGTTSNPYSNPVKYNITVNGISSRYAASTDATTPNFQAYISGVGQGCGIAPHDWLAPGSVNGQTLYVYPYFSAWVTDWCYSGEANWCFYIGGRCRSTYAADEAVAIARAKWATSAAANGSAVAGSEGALGHPTPKK